MKHSDAFGDVDPSLFEEIERASWRPIETAPKDGTQILCYDPNNVYAKIYVVRWNPEDSFRYEAWEEAAGECYAEWEPTHWMPLPLPPIEKE